MSKIEFLKWLEEKRGALAMWNVSVDEENLSDYVVGCFYDSKSETWKVYINKERGKHRVRLETKDEEQAFSKLRALVEYVIENNRGYI